jgi:hypothetical protein
MEDVVYITIFIHLFFEGDGDGVCRKGIAPSNFL